MKEIWKPVKEYGMYSYDGGWRYEVSNLGNVRRAGYVGYRKKYREPKMLKPAVDRYGYTRVILSDGHTRYTIRVHRLVASAFVPRSRWAGVVIHNDGDKTNNHADNLSWVTSSGSSPYVRGTAKTVRQYTLDGVLVAEYASGLAASRATGFDNRTISKCCHRRKGHKTFKGFLWRFAIDDEFSIKG